MKKEPLIAVVAMSGVFPGATGLTEFWNNLVHKVDATIDIPKSRWSGALDWIFAKTHTSDKTYSKRACLVEHFSFSRNQYFLDDDLVESLEPFYQWILFATDDAIKQCRISSIDKKRIGAVIAAIALPTAASSTLARQISGSRLLNAMIPGTQFPLELSSNKTKGCRVVSAPASLIAKAFGFGGGTYTLDAACASSIYAVKLACNELQAFRADTMITGGVSEFASIDRTTSKICLSVYSSCPRYCL